MTSVRDRWPRLTLYALGISMGLILAGELTARALFAPPPEPYSRHWLVGVGWSPGFSCDRMTIDQPPRQFRLEVNPLGFRGRAMRSAKKDKNVYRIFFLGASTTENGYLEEERTFAGRVQSALDAHFKGDPRIEVANAGVAGTSTSHTISTLLHRVLPLQPDLVAVLVGHNDLSHDLSKKWEGQALLQPEPPPRFKDWLVGASRLVAILDRAGGSGNDKSRWYERRRAERNRRAFTKPDFDVRRGIADFERQLRRISWLCREQGAHSVFMTQPSLYKDVMKPEEDAALHMGSFADGQNFDVPTLKLALDAYNEATRSVARATDSILVDLAYEVPSDLDHLIDDVHLTANGNEAAANAITRSILVKGSLPGCTVVRPESR